MGTGNYAEVGTSDIPGKHGRKVQTNVTAAVESMINRARGVAAGVVSGAGYSQPVLERPHLDESAPSRMSRQAQRPFGKAVKEACGCYGWCRAPNTHERGDGITGYK